MNIADMLAGIKPRTKTVKLTDDKEVTLHELSTNARMKIETERQELAEKEDATSREYNENAAKVVAMSMLGIEREPSQDDIDSILGALGLDQLDGLYIEALKFSGLDEEAQEDARKN